MPISEQTLKALQELLLQDKELLVRTQVCNDANESAALIADSAEKAGIPVTQAELVEHFAHAVETIKGQDLSDQQLEAVAGGYVLPEEGFIVMSIFSFGIACAVVSIVQATGAEEKFTKKYC